MEKEEIALQLTLKIIDKEVPGKNSKIYDYDPNTKGQSLNLQKIVSVFNAILEILQTSEK